MKKQLFSCPDGHKKKLDAGVMGALCHCGKTMSPTATRDKGPTKKVLRISSPGSTSTPKRSGKPKRKKALPKKPPMNK